MILRIQTAGKWADGRWSDDVLEALTQREDLNAWGRELLQALLISVVSLRPAGAVEFPKLSAGLGLFPSFHDAGFFIAFATF